MGFLQQICLAEMLGDLTVTTFLILLTASVVVVGLMALFPLVDLAFEKPTTGELRHHDLLDAGGEFWQNGRAWLDLRSDFLPSPAAKDPTAEHADVVTLRLFDSAAAHTSSLITRPTTATGKDENLLQTIPPRPCAA
jgi:hypothetical protein